MTENEFGLCSVDRFQRLGNTWSLFGAPHDSASPNSSLSTPNVDHNCHVDCAHSPVLLILQSHDLAERCRRVAVRL